MSSNTPRPEDDRGRILPFQPRARPRADAPRIVEPEAPVEGVEKYARTGEPDNYRQRMINNGLGLAACVVLVVIGVWIANTMAEMRKRQDCVLSGRRNCAEVNVPPADP